MATNWAINLIISVTARTDLRVSSMTRRTSTTSRTNATETTTLADPMSPGESAVTVTGEAADLAVGTTGPVGAADALVVKTKGEANVISTDTQAVISPALRPWTRGTAAALIIGVK